MRNRYGWVLLGLVVASAATGTRARAQFNEGIVTNNNNCLLPDGNRKITVFSCTQQGARYDIANGFIKTQDNLCFDHGIVRGNNTGDLNARRVGLAPCHGGQSQVWYAFQNGLVQNAANPDVCLDISGGNDAAGGAVIVWRCSANANGSPSPNQRFYLGKGGVSIALLQAAGLAANGVAALNSGRSLILNNGARVVPTGGGHMVAAGGGNMVAAGGGNILSNANAGMVAAGAGNLLAVGGMSLVGNDGASLRPAIAGVGFQIRP